MLIKFVCENFRSIGNDPVCLDMVASPKIQMHPGHVKAAAGKTRLLRNAAIYGANAAGKSTLVRAFELMKEAVTTGAIPPSAMGAYCKAGRGLSNEETTFEVQIELNGNAYDYGFSCLLGHYRVTSEWLIELGDKPKQVFERTLDTPRLGEAGLERATQADLTRFAIYSEDFALQSASNPALLFLSSVGQGKRFSAGSSLEVFGEVLAWFAHSLQIIGAGQPSPTSNFYLDSTTLDKVADVLASFDTGVCGLAKRVVSMDELDKYVDAGVSLSIRQFLARTPVSSEQTIVAATVRSGDAFVGVERKGFDEPVVTILEIAHHGSSFEFEFGDESDGTKRLFDFMDILFSRQSDALFVIDEIDRSLHPMLTRQLIALFNEVHRDDGCQLVFTTHENDIMSYDYLRKDEIWFVDRSDQGTSRLYALDDFDSVRTDTRLSKQYLEGRYGGVPALSMGRALAALHDVEKEG